MSSVEPGLRLLTPHLHRGDVAAADRQVSDRFLARGALVLDQRLHDVRRQQLAAGRGIVLRAGERRRPRSRPRHRSGCRSRSRAAPWRRRRQPQCPPCLDIEALLLVPSAGATRRRATPKRASPGRGRRLQVVLAAHRPARFWDAYRSPGLRPRTRPADRLPGTTSARRCCSRPTVSPASSSAERLPSRPDARRTAQPPRAGGGRVVPRTVRRAAGARLGPASRERRTGLGVRPPRPHPRGAAGALQEACAGSRELVAKARRPGPAVGRPAPAPAARGDLRWILPT